MRIALAQLSTGSDPDANATLVAETLATLAGRDVDLVVFPEATMRAFGHPLAPVAEPVDGPWARRVAAHADAAHTTVVAGMFTPGEGGRVRNTVLVHGPDGTVHYDKIHLFDAFGFAESDTVTPGTEPLVHRVGEATIGVATCYDVRFPGLFTTLAERGAQVIVVPASWGDGPGKAEQWRLLTRARALDSTCFVVACDQARPTDGPSRAPTGVGGSLAVAPDGQVVGELGDEPGVLVVDLDLGEVERVRRTLPVLSNRRY